MVEINAHGRVLRVQRDLQIGLVDKLGNINDAVTCAARMAKVKDFTLREYPEKKTFLENLLKNYTDEVKMKALKEQIGEEQFVIFQQLKNIRNMIAVPQARLPFDVNIR